ALRPAALARGLRSLAWLVGYESIGQFRRSALHSLKESVYVTEARYCRHGPPHDRVRPADSDAERGSDSVPDIIIAGQARRRALRAEAGRRHRPQRRRRDLVDPGPAVA